MQQKCLAKGADKHSFEWVQNCVANCEAGTNEILAMQTKHAEVARLTYAKNIARCE